MNRSISSAEESCHIVGIRVVNDSSAPDENFLDTPPPTQSTTPLMASLRLSSVSSLHGSEELSLVFRSSSTRHNSNQDSILGSVDNMEQRLDSDHSANASTTGPSTLFARSSPKMEQTQEKLTLLAMLEEETELKVMHSMG